jgi:hypothetical protein
LKEIFLIFFNDSELFFQRFQLILHMGQLIAGGLAVELIGQLIEFLFALPFLLQLHFQIWFIVILGLD